MACALPSQLAEQLPHGRRRIVPPPVFAEKIARAIPEQSVLVVASAVFGFDRSAKAAAEEPLDRRAGRAAPILRLDRQRAAERVEAEEGVRSGHQDRRRDGRLRDEVPADHFAKRLVETHAVHVDRQPLRRAEERRRGVAAVVDVGLIRVALILVDVDARHAAIEVVGQIEGAAALDVVSGGCLHERRDLLDRQLHTRQRGRSDDRYRHGRGRWRLRSLRGLGRRRLCHEACTDSHPARGHGRESSEPAARVLPDGVQHPCSCVNGRRPSPDHGCETHPSTGAIPRAAGLFTETADS